MSPEKFTGNFEIILHEINVQLFITQRLLSHSSPTTSDTFLRNLILNIL